MSIQFACPRCARRLSIAIRKAGAEVPCPACGQRIIVPSPPPATPLPGILIASEPDAPRVIVFDPSLPPPLLPNDSLEATQTHSVPHTRLHDDEDEQAPTRRERKRRRPRLRVLLIGATVALLGIGSLIGLMTGSFGTAHRTQLPDSVNKFVASVLKDRHGREARIRQVEYLPIKGRTKPSNLDKLQGVARDTLMNADARWPQQKGLVGNGGPSNWDKERVEKIIKDQGLGVTKSAPPPEPDLRVDGAYLVEFREPVWAGADFDDRLHNRVVFIMRPGRGTVGNAFDVIFPEDHSTGDWQVAVRSLVTEQR